MAGPGPGTRAGVTIPAAPVLVVGWSSFLHGEATAGDVQSMLTVRDALRSTGLPAVLAWSRVMCPPGGLVFDDLDPIAWSRVVFVCGPLTGPSIVELHRRFAHARRVAVGVSVPDPREPAAVGFHAVIARDQPGSPGHVDLAARRAAGERTDLPVVGVALAGPQPEYGDRQRHTTVGRTLDAWLATAARWPAAILPLDTRLDPRDWRLAARPDQFAALVRRLDVLVTTRLHGLVFALRERVPVVAVDPISGGGKVSAQAAAWGWPVVLPAECTAAELTAAWRWCVSAVGRGGARQSQMGGPGAVVDLTGPLVEVLTAVPGSLTPPC